MNVTVGFILESLFNPKKAPILFGFIVFIGGIIALVLGSIPGMFIFFGFAVLIFTPAEIRFWHFTVSGGLGLIVAGILWAVIAPLVH